MENAQFDSLVTGFYRAATGEVSWADALHPVQAAFGARTAVLQTMGTDSGQLLSLHNSGTDLHEAALNYVREYHHIDPRRAALIKRGAEEPGQWWHCNQHFDANFSERDRFHREFLVAYDTRFLSCTMLTPTASTLCAFGLELPGARGPLTADEVEWARRLGLHMQDALVAYERVRRLTAQALAGHTMLSNFPYPMWLIDFERYVHFANAPAQGESDSAQRAAQRGPHLHLQRPRADSALTEKLHALQLAGHGSTGVVDARRSLADSPAWLHLSALIPQSVFGAFGERPMVLATLFNPERVSTLDPFALAAVFKLTPAQARVATQLADGLTGERIASVNGTSQATVRSHVRGVLRCLGAQRTSDAVRMLRQGQALWTAEQVTTAGKAI